MTQLKRQQLIKNILQPNKTLFNEKKIEINNTVFYGEISLIYVQKQRSYGELSISFHDLIKFFIYLLI